MDCAGLWHRRSSVGQRERPDEPPFADCAVDRLRADVARRGDRTYRFASVQQTLRPVGVESPRQCHARNVTATDVALSRLLAYGTMFLVATGGPASALVRLLSGERERQGVSYDRLAERVGATRQGVSNWFKGDVRKIPFVAVVLIADELGVPLATLADAARADAGATAAALSAANAQERVATARALEERARAQLEQAAAARQAAERALPPSPRPASPGR